MPNGCIGSTAINSSRCGARGRERLAHWRGETKLALSRLGQCWAMDFVSDALADGRKLKMLTVVDSWTRQCLAIEVDTSLGGQRVSRVLEGLDPLPGIISGWRRFAGFGFGGPWPS